MPWKFFNASGSQLTATDNVTVAALADGTDGELITWDTAGAPATVAVGTSGHVLTSGGTGVAPTFQAAAGTTINTNADNRVITGSGTADTLNGEANLTFDGTNLTVGTGNVIVGTAGKGVDFSNQASPAAGMASELLDHYEEGTFTPTFLFAATAQASASAVGKYTRIGRVVTYQITIYATSKGSHTASNALYIGGFPFVSSGTIGGNGSFRNIAMTNFPSTYFDNGLSYMATMKTTTAGALTQITWGDCLDSMRLDLSGVYTTT